jgi:UDP-GlcNAc:undecaprenyl-phosphate/decaprenyl-phosphate GlcNAc-1-phosphate transferase
LDFLRPNIINLFSTLILSLFISLLVSGLSIMAARRIKLIDFPGSKPHKQHSTPTPIAGGISLLITLFLLLWTTGIINKEIYGAILLAGIPIFLFGVWDDYKNILPTYKIIGQLLSISIILFVGIRIRIFESPEFFIHGSDMIHIFLDQLVTVLWVLVIVNAFNLVDSMDGLAIGLASITAAFFVLFSIESQQTVLAKFCVIILGICIGIYFYNAPPAKLFMGDSGAQLLGFIFAIVAIIYTPENAYQTSSWLAPILILGIPIFDTSLVILSRLRRNLPIYEPGKDHTYHRLLHLGISPNQAVIMIHITSIILGAMAFIIINSTPFFANISFAIIILLGGIMLVILDRKVFWN